VRHQALRTADPIKPKLVGFFVAANA